MNSDGTEVRAFACPHCEKKLKAPVKAAGRTVDCPKCGQKIVVPAAAPRTSQLAPSSPAKARPVAVPSTGPKPANPVVRPASPVSLDGLMALNVPAIEDIEARAEASAEVKAEKAKKREAVRARNAPQRNQGIGKLEPVVRAQAIDGRSAHANMTGDRNGSPIQFDSDEELFGPAGNTTSPAPTPPKANKVPVAKPDAAVEAPRSVFDEDLPELAVLSETTKRSPSIDQVLASHLPESSAEIMDDLNSMIPDVPARGIKKPLNQAPVNEKTGQYRVVCKTCGTAQYVAPKLKGMKIKCPDCFIEYKVPPPPSDWKPNGKSKPELTEDNLALAKAEAVAIAQSADARRERTSNLLEKAKREISDEELESLYDQDFDTAGFLQRTFGFLRDTIVIAQIIGYGIVFAILFAVAQMSASDTEGFFGRGLLLLSVILIPMVGILFALPMLSGGLSLIESVANKQRRVTEIPGFNLFENFGDVILITISLAAAVVPGYLVGMLLGGQEDGAVYFRISGMMVSCFALFPLILLSMLDNGSLFQPISGSIIKSLKDAAEAWGGYYLKTLIAFFSIMVVWILLLGRSPMLAALAGSLLPLLVFFTCQQIGALADAISDHLSFEFTPPSKDDEQDEGDVKQA